MEQETEILHLASLVIRQKTVSAAVDSPDYSHSASIAFF